MAEFIVIFTHIAVVFFVTINKDYISDTFLGVDLVSE